MRFVFVLALALAACHSDPQPAHPAAGELPPLPPASGTPVGYLIDSSGDLNLRDDQLQKLKDIDSSLAAQNADIDVQLRQIEKPEPEEELTPQQQKQGMKRDRQNHAPGASVITNSDAAKLHQMHAANDKAAIKQAWALLDATQQPIARKILEDRGVEVPNAPKQHATHDDSAGQPLPGMEP
ncbi:MAG: hypothetical protein ABI467_02625 [Kofleriaceae bacterium]